MNRNASFLSSLLPSVVLFGLVTPVFAVEQATAEQATVKYLDFEPRDAKRDRVVPVRVYLHRADVGPASRVVLTWPGWLARKQFLSGQVIGPPLDMFVSSCSTRAAIRTSGSPRVFAIAWQPSSRPPVPRVHAIESKTCLSSSISWKNGIRKTIIHCAAKLDLEHIGMSGHSFGAVTTLAVAGRKFPFGKSFAEQRIDAFFAMSPQPGQGLSARARLWSHQRPMLCMTGTKDDSPINDQVTPESRREVFKALPAGDKYELVFDGGHHFTFGDSDGFRTRRTRSGPSSGDPTDQLKVLGRLFAE